jgi:hypothetical protein
MNGEYPYGLLALELEEQALKDINGNLNIAMSLL